MLRNSKMCRRFNNRLIYCALAEAPRTLRHPILRLVTTLALVVCAEELIPDSG